MTERRPTGPATDREDPQELDRLRSEVAELRARLATTEPGRSTPAGGPPEVSSTRRRGWWRPFVVVTLVLVAAVLAPASVVARWAHDEVADTDRYVETVAPLAQDPAVQQAVVDRVTAELFARIDVKAVTDQAVAALGEPGPAAQGHGRPHRPLGPPGQWDRVLRPGADHQARRVRRVRRRLDPGEP